MDQKSSADLTEVYLSSRTITLMLYLRPVANHVDQAVAGNVQQVLVIDRAKVVVLHPTSL